MVITFSAYTQEDVEDAKRTESYPDAVVFNWLHNAFFARDPRGGPIIPLSYDKLDTAVEVAKAFKECRVAAKLDDEGLPISYKLNPDGAAFHLSKDGLTLLEQHVRVMIEQRLGSGEAELAMTLKAWIMQAKALDAKKDADDASKVVDIKKPERKEA